MNLSPNGSHMRKLLCENCRLGPLVPRTSLLYDMSQSVRALKRLCSFAERTC